MSDILNTVQVDTAVSSKPPVNFKTKVPLCFGLAWPGQSGTFVLKSTGGFLLKLLGHPVSCSAWELAKNEKLEPDET